MEPSKENDTCSNSASIAAATRGAIKTGKAVTGIAKGASLGPYGMAAAGVWQNRKIIGMILVSILFLFFLPILFLLMLPSLIFGSFETTGEAINNNTIILEHITETEKTIEAILEENYEKTKAKIEQEASQLGTDITYSITDNFGDITFETLQVISRFCASENNYEEIQLSKLKEKLRDTDFFTYSVEIKTQEIETEISGEKGEREEQGKNEIKTITIYEYRIDYLGVEQVFPLTEEQISLASDYAENLYLFLYDTTYNPDDAIQGDYPFNPNLQADEIGNEAVRLALTKLGATYSQARRYEEGYYDCSSLTWRVYRALGIDISYQGVSTASYEGRYIVENQLAIPFEELAPGDLIFYSFDKDDYFLHISHVAIYAGDGYLIDASSSLGRVVYRKVYSKDKIVLCGRPYGKVKQDKGEDSNIE